MNRFLYLFGHLSDMTDVMRTPLNQHQAFIEPLVAWLRPRGVNFLTGAFVQDIGFAPSPGRMTVNRLDYERGGGATSVAVAPEDIVLVTTGSQAADLSAGSMTEVPRPRPSGRSWALWTRLAEGRKDFGNPDAFFGEARIPDVALGDLHGHRHRDRIHRPNVRADRQRAGTRRARDAEGLGLGAVAVCLPPAGNHRPAARHERLVGLRSVSRTHRRLCEETHGSMHRRGDPGGDAAAPAVRPAIGRDHGIIDLHALQHALRQQCLAPPEPRRQASRGSRGVDQSRTHRPVRRGPKEIAFTIEYSVRTAWEAIYVLLKRGPAPPPVYQGQYDPKALFNALKVFVCQ